MARWHILNASAQWVGTQNSGDTAEQAIALFIERETRPIYCRYHSGMKPDQIDMVSGDGMVYFKRDAPEAQSAVRMREVYMDGGYCLVPAEG